MLKPSQITEEKIPKYFSYITAKKSENLYIKHYLLILISYIKLCNKSHLLKECQKSFFIHIHIYRIYSHNQQSMYYFIILYFIILLWINYLIYLITVKFSVFLSNNFNMYTHFIFIKSFNDYLSIKVFQMLKQ